MKGFKRTLPVLLLSILCYACKGDTEVTEVTETYKFFNLERAGWKSRSVSQHFSDIAYTATVVPIQYYIIKNEGLDDPSRVDSIYRAHRQERVIEMEFRHGSGDDLLRSDYTKMDYEESVKYMAFSMEKDFMAVTKAGDSIPCSGLTFERNFKLAPFKRLLLHFGNVPEDGEVQLVYHDRLFGNGILKFKFKETPLKL